MILEYGENVWISGNLELQEPQGRTGLPGAGRQAQEVAGFTRGETLKLPTSDDPVQVGNDVAHEKTFRCMIAHQLGQDRIDAVLRPATLSQGREEVLLLVLVMEHQVLAEKAP
jgi:hypothetical protein